MTDEKQTSFARSAKQIPGTNPPILYYDLKGASGATGGVPKGARVAVHYDLKFRSITVGTSRQGAGVTGGTPIGFTVGQPAGKPGGPFIKAFNEGKVYVHMRGACSGCPSSMQTLKGGIEQLLTSKIEAITEVVALGV